MADEIDVKIKATTQPLQEGMERAEKAVKDGAAEMRSSFQRVDERLEAHARNVDAWAKRVESSSRDGAHGFSAAWGSAAVQWNQTLDLLQKGMRAVEATWDATVGGVITRGEDLQAMSRRLATAPEELSSFTFVAQQAGVGLEAIGTGYRSLAKAMVEGAQEGTEANRILVGGLGLTVDEITRLQALAPHEAIIAIGEALNRYDDDATKAVAAQQLFGRSYQAVLQLLAEGPATIRQNVALAERLGLVMSGETTDGADRLGDAIGTLHAAWDGFFNRLFGDADFLNTLSGIVEDNALMFADMGRNMPADEADALRDAVAGLTRELANMLPTGTSAAGILASIANALAAVARNRAALVTGGQGAGLGGAIGGVVGFAAGGPGGAALGMAVGSTLGGLGGARVGAAEDAARNEVDAIIAQTMQEWDDAAAQLRLKMGISGLGMTTEEGIEVPSGDLGPDVPPAPRGSLVVPPDPKGAENAAKAAATAAQRARQEEFQALLRDQQQALAAERDNAEDRLAIVTEFSERIKARFGEESEEFDRQKLVQIQAEEQAKQQRDRISLAKVEFTKQQLLAELEEERRTLEHKKAMGEISANEELDALRDLYERRYLIILEAIQRERELTGNDPARQGQLDQEEQQAGGQLQADQLEVLREKQLLIKQSFDEVFSAIGQSFDRSILGMIQGTQTLGQAVGNMGRNILAQMISLGIQMLARWAAMQAAKLLISRLTDQAEVSSMATASAQKTAVQAPETIQQIMNNAYGAASGGANAMASIPYVGPILAVANAAMLLALVAGYAANVSAAGGMDEVGPQGAFAQLHPKEMVLSAGLAERVRRMTTTTPAEGGADDMPSTPATRQPVVVNVSMIDTRGAKDFFERYGGHMADSLERTGRLRQGA